MSAIAKIVLLGWAALIISPAFGLSVYAWLFYLLGTNVPQFALWVASGLSGFSLFFFGLYVLGLSNPIDKNDHLRLKSFVQFFGGD